MAKTATNPTKRRRKRQSSDEEANQIELFALDATLDLPSDTDAEALGDAMDERVIEQTQLDGTYPV